MLYQAFEIQIDGKPVQVFHNTKERGDMGELSPLAYHFTLSEKEAIAGESGDGFDIREIAQKLKIVRQDIYFARLEICDELLKFCGGYNFQKVAQMGADSGLIKLPD